MILHFYIELKNSTPLVWRRLLIPSTSSFYQLHLAIQGAFGWENAHLFQFSATGRMNEPSYGLPDPYEPEPLMTDARKAKIGKVFQKAGQTYTYLYDFGDYWQHGLVLEKIERNDATRPFCTAGAGACPPEDVGGMGGYQQMLESLHKKNDPEQAGYRKWLGLQPGETWDADFCDLREVNKRLCLLG
jgi:hypothetical protein